MFFESTVYVPYHVYFKKGYLAGTEQSLACLYLYFSDSGKHEYFNHVPQSSSGSWRIKVFNNYKLASLKEKLSCLFCIIDLSVSFFRLKTKA